MLKGIVFTCSKDFIIDAFVYNNLKNTNRLEVGSRLSNICDAQEAEKVTEFEKQLSQEGAAFNWEINVLFDDIIKPLRFSGSRINGRFFVFALESNNDMPFLYEELMRINNDQSNYIRKIIKDRFLYSSRGDHDDNTLEELSKLNNELANLQRELAKKNTELIKLNEIKNRFLGMAAHDLRNPLGHIYNYAELIEDDIDNLSEAQQKFLSVIKSQSMFMVNLVNELLDFSVIESGKVTLNLKQTNLIELLTSNIDLSKKPAEKKSIVLNFSTPVASLPIFIDEEKISQVISNLISNAIKYSEQNTAISISVMENDSEVVVSVVDQGVGIQPNELAELFKPFQTTSNRSTGGEKSTGLGLFISKRIIESHHGKLWAESKPRIGSSFYFSISKQLNLHDE